MQVKLTGSSCFHGETELEFEKKKKKKNEKNERGGSVGVLFSSSFFF